MGRGQGDTDHHPNEREAASVQRRAMPKSDLLKGTFASMINDIDRRFEVTIGYRVICCLQLA